VWGSLDLSALYAKYGSRGGEPYAPEMLLGLLLYGSTTGVFSSRKIERATYESVAFCFIAGNAHPDHDTLAAFRHTFLPELKDLFAQILLLAKAAGVLKLGTISLDGTKVHAMPATRKAVSYKRLLELETQLRAEVEKVFILSEQSEQPEVPGGLVVSKEIARRQDRLAGLAEAKVVLEARAKEREGSSKRYWASASSRCVGSLQRLVSGVSCVWLLISSAFTRSPGRKAGNTGANDIRPPHDRQDSASEQAPFSCFFPCHQALLCYRSGWRDPCSLLSDKLLARDIFL
jgi:transposase